MLTFSSARFSSAIIFCYSIMTTMSCGDLNLRSDHKKDPPKEDLSLTESLNQGAFVFGDSLSTGAVTHPDTKIDVAKIFGMVKDSEIYPIDPKAFGDSQADDENTPVRILGRSDEDFFASLSSDLAGDVNKVIETPMYSWGGQLADLENNRSSFLIAAENGARASAGATQVGNLIERLNADGRPLALPAKVFIFFSGNDMCAGESFDEMTSPEDYAAGLQATIKKLMDEFSVFEKGTTIYVMSHLDLVSHFTNGDIFKEKTVTNADGDKLTCQKYLGLPEPKVFADGKIDLAKLNLKDLANENLYHPQKICKSLLSLVPGAGIEPVLDADAAKKQLEAYRQGAEAMVKEMQANISDERLSLVYVKDTESLTFAAEDIANDCFHLSVNGQEKIAAMMQKVVD